MKRGTETGSLLQLFVSVMRKEEICCNLILGKVESTHVPICLRKEGNSKGHIVIGRQWSLPPAFLIISQTWKPLPKTRRVFTSDIPDMDNLSHVSPNTGLQKLHTYPGLSSVKTFWTIYFVVKIIQYISVIQLLKQLWKMCFCAIQSGSHRKVSLKTAPLLHHVDGFWTLSPPLENDQTMVSRIWF